MDGSTPYDALYRACVASDDEAAWGELIRRFDPWVATVAWNALRLLDGSRATVEEARDVRQETWFRLLRDDRRAIRSAPERGEEELRAYLRAIATNVVRDRRKARSMQKRPRIAPLSAESLEEILARAVDRGPGPDEEAAGRHLAERIAPLLRREWADRPTCERDIAVCQLSLVDGLSAARIAAIAAFGLSRGGVEKVVDRGRRVLQRHLGGPGARSRLVDDGHDATPPPPFWKDLDEVVAFLAGTLDRETTAARTTLLAEDPRARRLLDAVARQLEAPIEPSRREELLHPAAPELLQRLLRRTRRRPRVAWASPAAAAAAAAVLLLALLGPAPDPRPGPPAPGETIPYPSGVAAPLRMAQPFVPEAPGPTRGGEPLEPAVGDRLQLVEQELLIERSRGGDPVATSTALGHLKLARGRLELAARNYALALEHDPDNAQALLGLAVVRWRQAFAAEGPPDGELLRQADRILQRVPSASLHYPLALYDRIQVALALDEVERAAELLERYRQVAPEDGWLQALQTAVRRSGRS